MNVLDYLLNLYKKKSQMQLLSMVYIFVSVVIVLLAGLIALVNQSVGVAFLIVPLISMITFCMNIVVWAIIRFVLDSLCIHYKRKTLDLAIKDHKAHDEEAEKIAIREIEAKIKTKKSSKSTTGKKHTKSA